MEIFERAQQIGITKHPLKTKKFIPYGVSGFRTTASELECLMYRIGLVAALRSKATKQVIGVMITASHNPEEDNGTKLIDPLGQMLLNSWEAHATELANIKDEEVQANLMKLVANEDIDMNAPAHVFIARDTRPSSESLAQSVRDGVEALQAKITDFGLLTTPMLHFIVRSHNTNGQYGEPTEQGYYEKFSKAFKLLKAESKSKINGHYTPNMILDGSNGIGGVIWKSMAPYVKDDLQVTLINDGSGSGRLNYRCGADFVKNSQQIPDGLVVSPEVYNVRCATYDGDADRIVYFFIDQDGHFKLLDGDRLATLVAGYLKDIIAETSLNLNLGLLQTAYANGGSTNYITQHMKVPVTCIKTGVKHLHVAAKEYDVSVWFEANGHGTALFSDAAIKKITDAAKSNSLPDNQRAAAQKLLNIVDLINQTVGDAISDMLLIEVILHGRGWSCQDWYETYTDLPNRMTKITVKDRHVIETTDAERKATSPEGLQLAIDELVKKYPCARSFTRPSGTEDIVRVYAEADTRENADALAYEVSVKVYELAGGIGDRPKPL